MNFIVIPVVLLLIYMVGLLTLGTLYGDAVQHEHVFICLLVFGTLGALAKTLILAIPGATEITDRIAKAIDIIAGHDTKPDNGPKKPE